METRGARNEENLKEREEGVEQEQEERERRKRCCNANSWCEGIRFGNGEGENFPRCCFGSYEPFGVFK